MFFDWAMVFFPLAAIYFGRKALRQIERMPEEYTGRAMAKTGIWLAAGLGIIFTGFWIFGGAKSRTATRRSTTPSLNPTRTTKARSSRRRRRS